MKYIEIFWNEVFMVRNAVKLAHNDIRPLAQGRNMVYGLRAQSPKYDWDQGSEERAQGSEEWDQGSQGF